MYGLYSAAAGAQPIRFINIIMIRNGVCLNMMKRVSLNYSV